MASQGSNAAHVERPIRVLHLLSGEGLYGAERAVLSLAAQGRAMGDDHRLGLVGLQPGATPKLVIEEAIALGGIPADLLTERSGSGTIGLRPVVIDAIVAFRPDVVHVHGYKSAVLGAMARLTSLGPWGLIATLHGWTSLGRPGRAMAYELLERVSLASCDAVVGVSEQLCARVRRFPRIVPVSCVPNPIPLRAERVVVALPRPEGKRTLCYVGRLSHEKGIDLLLAAFAQLSSIRGDVHLLIAGEGPERQRLDAACVRLGISDHVQFLGFVSDPRPLYDAADLVVLPSRTEGMPLVVLEALVASAPVVATDVGEVRKLLADGQYGWLVAPESIGSLSHALASALANRQEARSRAMAGASAVVKQFGSASVYTRYRTVYESVILARGTKLSPGALMC